MNQYIDVYKRQHREGQIGIAAVVHQRTPLARPAGEPGATGTGNPGQPLSLIHI